MLRIYADGIKAKLTGKFMFFFLLCAQLFASPAGQSANKRRADESMNKTAEKT